MVFYPGYNRRLVSGYALADAGFDVWLGNARGTYYSRRHVTLNPDEDLEFWQFSWDDIGHKDLAASIDYVVISTGRPQLHFVSHSQGIPLGWETNGTINMDR